MAVQEVSEATGTPQEETYFTLPTGAAATVRKVPGFESYNGASDVLFALDANAGTVGAPRAFGVKLAEITRGPPFYLRPLSRDAEVEVGHKNGELQPAIAKNTTMISSVLVDKRGITLFTNTPEAVFGKPKIP